MRDGSDLRGLLKLSSGNKIKFKKTKKDKKQTFDYKEVSRVKFLFEEEFLYKINIKSKRHLLIKRVVKGKLNLYSLISYNPGLLMGNPGSPVIGASSQTIYYVGKENSDYIEVLPSIDKKKFIKILSKQTSDCQEFLNMIKDKENIEYFFEKKESESERDFIKKDSRIEQMINYYNSHCN
ncbi:hypothetical protein BTO14_03550 [Polaribacter butkevichii]|uniref:Uncharacterized protein n=2 Tax=Polaribacter butkevichii TaxID=218490 RepID=A0A2P6CBU8_9FLAO|nr:hypothetical protein BTO14_03550 [Polaribacter butkevichii]